ncbi:hypothetical protein CEXT_808721 [Caerostris extrusa]|uniref:Uncharacterized protein n=1 Tax=Caerostris extrusa TaxID=172846 RepID=A0AAV4MWK7_CAEEX|nr:hypothetical protein CEXT_808721 [Caerostris extrusa]
MTSWPRVQGGGNAVTAGQCRCCDRYYSEVSLPPFTGEKGIVGEKAGERRAAAIISALPVSCEVPPLFAERTFSISFLLFFFVCGFTPVT